MYGNILLGSTQYADTQFGVYAAEVTVDISISTNGVALRVQGTLSTFPSIIPRIPELDISMNIQYLEELFVPKIGIGAYGNFDEFGIELLSQLGLGAYSTFKIGKGFDSAQTNIGLGITGYFSVVFADDNVIQWSNIGALDFTIDQSNVAGKIPMNWEGYVYSIEQLGNSSKAVVYGANGISIIQAKGVYFGQTQIMDIGLLSKHSVVNTKVGHFFVDKTGDLYSVSLNGEFKFIGYREFLVGLTGMVISFDSFNDLIYLCDGTSGYVYAVKEDCLTEGPVNVTGFAFFSGNSYMVAPAQIVNPVFSIKTDVFDMKTRKGKNINTLEISTDYTGNLLASIDYRINSTDSFSTSPWFTINPSGIINIPCYGREFRFNIKAETLADFTVDWIRVNGIIHGFKYLDSAITMA